MSTNSYMFSQNLATGYRVFAQILSPHLNRTHGTGNSKRLINPNNISAHWTPNLAYIEGANRGNKAPKVYLRRQFAAMAEALFGLLYRSIRYFDVPSCASFVSFVRRWRGEGKKNVRKDKESPNQMVSPQELAISNIRLYVSTTRTRTARWGFRVIQAYLRKASALAPPRLRYASLL